MSTEAPEQKARRLIDASLAAAGWQVQNQDELNLYAARGVAVREFQLTNGYADYLLFVDQQPVGVLEAKAAGHTLSGVEVQATKYAEGLPPNLEAPVLPLPFLYLSTGTVTKFINLLDPKPRSRKVFAVHQPDSIARWLKADTLDAWVKSTETAYTAAASASASSSMALLSFSRFSSLGASSWAARDL